MSTKLELVKQFIHSVALMRQSQKQYFAKRQDGDLQNSKRYEALVDAQLSEIRSLQTKLPGF